MVIVEMIITDREGSFCIKIDNVFRFIGFESVSRSRYCTGLDFLSKSAICPEELPSIFVFFQYDSRILCSLTISRAAASLKEPSYSPLSIHRATQRTVIHNQIHQLVQPGRYEVTGLVLIATHRNTAFPQACQDAAHGFQLQLLRKQIDEHMTNVMDRHDLVDEVILVFIKVIDQPFRTYACGPGFQNCAFDKLLVVVNADPGDSVDAFGVYVI